MANEGDTRPFIRFIADCTEKTLDLFLWATNELSHQVPLLSDPEDDYQENHRILSENIIENESGSGENATK